MKATILKETEYSTLREAIFEHKFISDFLEYCWENDEFNAEVVQNSIDNSGYDLIVLVNGKINYIQLKVTANDTDTSDFPIHSRLVDKDRAFILLTEYDRSNLKDYSYYLLKVDRALWSQNRKGKREQVRHIKRTLLTGGKKAKNKMTKTIKDIFSDLRS